MKKYILSISIIAGFFFTACSKQPEFKTICPPNTNWDKNRQVCVATTMPLKGVVENVQCFGNKCYAIIDDERGRKIKVPVDKDTKIGDMVNIILYTKPKKVPLKKQNNVVIHKSDLKIKKQKEN